MLDRLTIEKRLEIFARNAKLFAPLKLWKNQVLKLQKEGCDVDVIFPTNRKGEYYCIVYWEEPHGPLAAALRAITLESVESNF